MAVGQYTATTALVQMIPANPKRIATTAAKEIGGAGGSGVVIITWT